MMRRRAGANLSRPSQAQTTEEEPVSEASRRCAEFRLAVVGHLVVRDVERGQLRADLKSLSAKKWNHPISGRRVMYFRLFDDRAFVERVGGEQELPLLVELHESIRSAF